jgi:hypothetical protein
MQIRKFHFSSVGLSVAICAALVGCASGGPAAMQGTLTYESMPEGATIYEGGQALGVAPVTKTYSAAGSAGPIKTPEVTAVWPSGAKESYFTFLPPGADRVATIERPKSAPNLQADLDNAKRFVFAKEAEAKRIKENNSREMSRASDRCKDQQSKGTVATNDC